MPPQRRNAKRRELKMRKQIFWLMTSAFILGAAIPVFAQEYPDRQMTQPQVQQQPQSERQPRHIPRCRVLDDHFRDSNITPPVGPARADGERCRPAPWAGRARARGGWQGETCTISTTAQ